MAANILPHFNKIFQIYKKGERNDVQQKPTTQTLQLPVCFICSVTYRSISIFSLSINPPFFMHKKRFNPQMFQHDIINQSSILVTKPIVFASFLSITLNYFLYLLLAASAEYQLSDRSCVHACLATGHSLLSCCQAHSNMCPINVLMLNG